MEEETQEEVKKDKVKFIKSEFKLVEVVVSILITMVIGIIIGYAVTTKFSSSSSKLFKNDKYLKEFIDTYEEIQDEYYKDVDKKDLISYAISGMLSVLGDPYSVYMDEDTTDDFNERLYGDYEGIGAEISMTEDGKVIIYSTFKDSPAEKSGLKKNDIILEIDGENVENKNSSEVSNMIKTSTKSEVKIKIKREGKELTLTVKRQNITLDSVTHEIYEKNGKKIGYINISIFAANSYSQFRNAVLDLEKSKIDSLIIDVRNNSGGYLDSVTDMLGMFLEKGSIIYQLDDKGKITKKKDDTKEKRDYKVAVIINEYSASASEILASAFKENYGGEIIGVHSYGKGTVQQTKELKTGGMMKFTTQKWLTPKGNWINEKGVEPTIEEKLNENYYEDPKIENDNQLQKAIEILAK